MGRFEDDLIQHAAAGLRRIEEAKQRGNYGCQTPQHLPAEGAFIGAFTGSMEPLMSNGYARQPLSLMRQGDIVTNRLEFSFGPFLYGAIVTRLMIFETNRVGMDDLWPGSYKITPESRFFSIYMGDTISFAPGYLTIIDEHFPPS